MSQPNQDKLRKFQIKWTKGDQVGFATIRSTNAQRARIQFESQNDVDEAEVVTKTRTKPVNVNFYEAGMSILAAHISLGPKGGQDDSSHPPQPLN